jgi:catalase
LFSGVRIPVTVRFSDATGIPKIADGSALANPHGMAIKFHLADGSETDMVLNSLKFFPVSSAADFRDMLVATAESPPNTPKTDKARAIHHNPPDCAACAGDGAYARQFRRRRIFVFVNGKGEKCSLRYIATPENLLHLEPAEAAKLAPDFLLDELTGCLARGPVTFRLRPSLHHEVMQRRILRGRGPESNEIVELGVLTIVKPVSDSADAQRTLLFLPGQLTEGIESSVDPMI